MKLEAELRTASDRMLRTLEQLEMLETEKRTLIPGSPRFRKLAEEVERLAANVFAHTHAQKQLADQALAAAEQDGATLPPIEETAHVRDVQLILADWREAERRLAAADPDSAEHAQAVADIGRLRDEYHRAYSASTRRTE